MWPMDLLLEDIFIIDNIVCRPFFFYYKKGYRQIDW